MRETHDYLTTETEETLDGNVKAVAYGLDKTKEAVYQIVRGEARDPFAPFVHFAEGIAKGKVSLQRYISTLQTLEQRYVNDGRRVRNPGEAIQTQFHEFSRFTEEFMSGISDGTLDIKETDNLLGIISVLKPLVDASETSLLAHKAKLEKDGAK